MPQRLPAIGGDNNNWGAVLNGFLGVALNADGTLNTSATITALGAAATAVSVNNQKITNLANGTAASDAAAFGQIPTSFPPSGTAGGDLTGTYPNPTVTSTANFKTQVETVGLDQMAAPTASVALNSQKITGLANGSAATDAAAFGQIPANLPPSGTAGGDLTGTYPNPTLITSGVTAAAYTNANITVDAKGRVTVAASGVAPIVLTPTAVKTFGSSPYSAVASDFVPVDTTSGIVVVNLPNAPADKTTIGVKMVTQGSTNTVTINRNGSGTDVFNKSSGATSITLTLLNQGAIVQYASSTGIWYVINDDLNLAQLDLRYPLNTATPGGDLVGSGSTYAAPVLSGTANVESVIKSISWDQFTPAAANANVGSHQIINLTAGTRATDAANLSQTSGAWIPDTATWTRTANTTFTIAANVTAQYVKGTKVKWAESATVKYGVVATSSYSSPNTTVTLIATSDYVMAASPDASSTYYSYSFPLSFPTGFAWTPTGYTGFSTNPAVPLGWWAVNDGICTMAMSWFSAGTSNATTFTLSNPINSGPNLTFNACVVTDSGTQGPGMVLVAASSSTITLTKAAATTTFATTGSKTAWFSMSYQI